MLSSPLSGWERGASDGALGCRNDADRVRHINPAPFPQSELIVYVGHQYDELPLARRLWDSFPFRAGRNTQTSRSSSLATR